MTAAVARLDGATGTAFDQTEGRGVDGERFDFWAKQLATGVSRRTVAKGLAGAVVAGVAALLGRSETDAKKVTQAYCGNAVCADDPSVCRDGCQCCVFGNGNSRCMPPQDCARYGGAPIGGGGTPPSQGTCADGANRCEDDTQLCNDNDACGCVPTVGGGTFCANGPNNQCAYCAQDSDCEQITGPGSACVVPTGGCAFCSEGMRICWAPCPRLT